VTAERVLGVDACKSGWIGIALTGETTTAYTATHIDVDQANCVLVSLRDARSERSWQQRSVSAGLLKRPVRGGGWS
jgi:hypothetical protein